jgi:tetratricopeptide (TPR) repeat protein
VVAAVPPPPADDTYEKALKEGNELFQHGKWKASIVAFQRAVRQRPESVPALLALGDAYLEADRPRSALEPLETAVRLDGQNGRAHLLLGTAYQSVGKNKAAVKAYQRYVELEPSGEFVKDVRLILANLAHSG